MAVIDLDLDPPPRALRVFGVASAVVFSGLGAFAWHKGWISTPVASGAFAVATCSLMAAVLWPKANRPLFVLLSVLAWPIGLVLSYVVLGLLFFGVLTPVGLLFRLIGRDPLRLRKGASAASHWVPYERRGTLERYFRQF